MTVKQIENFETKYINFRNLLIVSLLIVFCLQTCDSINKSNTIKDLKAQKLVDKQPIDSIFNTNGVKIIEQKPIEFTKDDGLRALSKQIFDLKKSDEKHIKEINLLVSTIQKVAIKDSTIIKYDTIPYYRKDSLGNVVDTGKSFSKETEYYTITGKAFNSSGVQIDSLSMENTITWQVIEQKKGIFKKRETIVQLINSNPYVDNIGVKSLIVKSKTGIWNKWLKPLIAASLTYLIIK